MTSNVSILNGKCKRPIAQFELNSEKKMLKAKYSERDIALLRKQASVRKQEEESREQREHFNHCKDILDIYTSRIKSILQDGNAIEQAIQDNESVDVTKYGDFGKCKRNCDCVQQAKRVLDPLIPRPYKLQIRFCGHMDLRVGN